MLRKLVLIIGNNDYATNPLKNCVNDANSLAKALRTLENCQITLHENLKSDTMYECIKAFTESIGHDDFVIFFFSGHGMQMNEKNYLLPCDNNRITTERDMGRFAINAQLTVNDMSERSPQVVLFLLDCCRQYWIPNKSERHRGSTEAQVGGLHQMPAPEQTLIAFSCASGAVVSDRSETSTNSRFTESLIRHITTPGIHVETMLRRVAKDVAEASKGQQRPFRVSSIISEELCLVPNTSATTDKIKSKSSPLHFSTMVNNLPKRDIHVLLLGYTGVGKTTFINALANYLVNDTLEKACNDDIQVPIPCSILYTDINTYEARTITIGRRDEFENLNANCESFTQKCRTFVFSVGDHRLRLIDTPPVGDSRGVQQDELNIENILTYISQYTDLHSICIFLKPNEIALSNYFRYCIYEILRHLPKSVQQNLIFIFTNARGVFFRPGRTLNFLRTVLDNAGHSFGVATDFIHENVFFVDNEAFRFLALSRNGVMLNDDEKRCFHESWNSTRKQYVRLLDRIMTRSSQTIQDITMLYQVQKIIQILITCPQYEMLGDSKIQQICRQHCQYLFVNAIVPYNEHLLEYIRAFIAEQREKQQNLALNKNSIHILEDKLKLNEKIQNEMKLSRELTFAGAGNINDIVATLYQSSAYGNRIRQQVEQLKNDLNKAPKQEIQIQLPTKASSSQLMHEFIKIMSK